MSGRSRATIRLHLACDNGCVFCGQHGLAGQREPASPDVVDAALAAARAAADEVTFVGGEPMLHPELPSLVAAARARGFRRVGVQTNGRRLARPELPRALAEAGLTDVHLSIHGGVAAAHDYHTGVEGSFAAAVSALAGARAAGLEVAVATVLTRSNARGLADLARLLAARGASAWCIEVPRVRGRALELFDRVVPRLGIAMPFALHAMQVAETVRLPAFVRGAPSCVLGPFARRALPDAPRAHGDACAACAARPECPGVEPEYLARFVGDELSPCATVARDHLRPERPGDPLPELARMFVGPGDLAEASARALPEPPARARVALPMLGKVQPARAEVPRSAEKKSGEALRVLFKDLFDKAEE